MKFIFLGLFLVLQSAYTQEKLSSVRPFLESIVTQFPNVRDIALTNNQTEAIFTAQSVMGDNSILISCEFDGTKWINVKPLEFSGNYVDMEPYFSADGLQLYFVSNRPLNSKTNHPKDFDIWYVERVSQDQPWSEPINLGAPINSDQDEFYPIITLSNNLYFTLDDKTTGMKDDIYISRFKNGSYLEPERLPNEINSDGYEFNAFVSKDESYMIYTCYNRKDGLGSGDLYISHKNENKWQKAINMGFSINSDKMDYCPYVDASKGVLYFTSKRLSTESTPYHIDSMKKLHTLFNKYENGSSRLYQVPFSENSRFGN